MTLILQCALEVFCGISLHILIRMSKAKKRTNAAGKVFSVKEFFADEIITILINLVVCMAVMVVMNQIANLKGVSPLLLALSFLTLGYTGSSIAMAFFSASEKKLIGTMKSVSGTEPDASNGNEG